MCAARCQPAPGLSASPARGLAAGCGGGSGHCRPSVCCDKHCFAVMCATPDETSSWCSNRLLGPPGPSWAPATSARNGRRLLWAGGAPCGPGALSAARIAYQIRGAVLQRHSLLCRKLLGMTSLSRCAAPAGLQLIRTGSCCLRRWTVLSRACRLMLHNTAVGWLEFRRGADGAAHAARTFQLTSGPPGEHWPQHNISAVCK
jgi:hypothetical protein